MNSFYLLIAVLVILLFLLFKILQKAATLVKVALFVIFIFFAITVAFTLDQTNKGNAAMMVTLIKKWIHSPVIQTSGFFDEHFDIPIIKIKDQVLLDVPAVSQFPELPRGCEVTSLSMLLNFAGIHTNKMELADKVKKDPTPHSYTNGQVYFGNPNEGFVGDMYSFQNSGFGVYHKPIAELAEKYLPGRVKDLTNSDFQELKTHLSDGRPVWVIINTSYRKLEEDQFQTWETPNGKVKITYREHSVLLTGYDLQYVYFNDPLTGGKNKKAPIKDFEESWVQMGSQAITYLP